MHAVKNSGIGIISPKSYFLPYVDMLHAACALTYTQDILKLWLSWKISDSINSYYRLF